MTTTSSKLIALINGNINLLTHTELVNLEVCAEEVKRLETENAELKTRLETTTNNLKSLTEALDKLNLERYQSKEKLEALQEDSKMLDWLIDSGAFMADDDGYYLIYNDDYWQSELFVTPREAIKAAMKSE